MTSCKLSAVVTSGNEAAHLARCLESLRFADEILVVDSFSTDGSLIIAEKIADRVLQHSYENPSRQKNWAFSQAKHDWILSIDADEVVPLELAKEITAILKTSQHPEFAAAAIRRRNFFLGTEIRHCGWNTDQVIRLLNRTLCKYDQRQVHEELQIDKNQQVIALQQPMYHYTCTDLAKYAKKTIVYAEAAANDLVTQGKCGSWYKILLKPLWKFLHTYLLRLGFLDGCPGLIVSGLGAYGIFLRQVFLWQKTSAGQTGFESSKTDNSDLVEKIIVDKDLLKDKYERLT